MSRFEEHRIYSYMSDLLRLIGLTLDEIALRAVCLVLTIEKEASGLLPCRGLTPRQGLTPRRGSAPHSFQKTDKQKNQKTTVTHTSMLMEREEI